MALNCGGCRPPDNSTKAGYLLKNSSNNATNEPLVTTMFAPGSSHMPSGSCLVGSLHDFTRGVMNASTRVHQYYGSSSHVQQQVGVHEMNREASYTNHNNQPAVADDGVEVVDEQGYSVHQSESKKRRLTNEQVKSLEVSFDMESKLEPERKNQLAQELGLQPRQVAVWFQNRRARYKTKQLERDYDILKQQYDAVRSEKDKLQAEVAMLKDLLDAQIAGGKGTFTSTNDQGQKELESQREKQADGLQNLCTSSTGAAGKRKASTPTSEQKAKISATTAEGDAFSSDNSDQTHVHVMVDATSKIPKDMKPSLVADHHLLQQQQQFHSNLNPTKLSLRSPQQVLLHHMIAVKMEENFNIHEPDYNLYNEHYNFHNIDHDHDDDEASDSMLCFTSWHHDP